MPDPVAEPAPVLRMDGDVDIATESVWRERADRLLAEHPDLRDLVVDLEQVNFLDSRGMSVLVHLHSAALSRGGKLTVRAVPPRVLKALTIAGLDQVFQIENR